MNIKSVVFDTTGILLLLISPLIFILSFDVSVFIVVCTVLVAIIAAFFLARFDASIGNNITVLGYLEYLLRFKRDIKTVHHSDLGKFIIYCTLENYCTLEKLYIYEQNYFYLRRISEFYIDNLDIDGISNKIKEILDKEYVMVKKINKSKNKIDDIKKWDGYLDTIGKRDDKIDKLLGVNKKRFF